MKKPSDRELEILGAIAHLEDKNGRPPAPREIANYLGFATSNYVSSPISSLETRGYLKRQGETSHSRTIKLITFEPAPIAEVKIASKPLKKTSREEKRKRLYESLALDERGYPNESF